MTKQTITYKKNIIPANIVARTLKNYPHGISTCPIYSSTASFVRECDVWECIRENYKDSWGIIFKFRKYSNIKDISGTIQVIEGVEVCDKEHTILIDVWVYGE